MNLPAGEFSAWLTATLDAIRGKGSADVPCDGCTACCRASQFIHIGPAEVDTLSHIPAELLFDAPRLPRGHVLMGYDERGHCPMLVEDRCSIYDHRPRTCRTYDCRVFPAAGVDPDDDGTAGGKVDIAARAKRWEFSFPTDDDRSLHDAVRAAATYIRDRNELMPGTVATNTQLAVLAVEAHGAFLTNDLPTVEAVRVELVRRRGAAPS